MSKRNASNNDTTDANNPSEVAAPAAAPTGGAELQPTPAAAGTSPAASAGKAEEKPKRFKIAAKGEAEARETDNAHVAHRLASEGFVVTDTRAKGEQDYAVICGLKKPAATK